MPKRLSRSFFRRGVLEVAPELIGATLLFKGVRGRIVEVAIRHFAERGYSAARVEDIAAQLGIAKGSAEPNKNRVGKITLKQVEEIAKIKMPDLNCFTVEAAMNSVKGTARSMGVDVEAKV